MSNDSPAAVLYDKNGNDFESVAYGNDHYLGVAVTQDVHTSTANSSTVQLPAFGSFTGTSEGSLGAAGLQVCVYADQPVQVQVQQSQDETNWDILDTYSLPPNLGDGRTVQAVGSYFRIVVDNLGPVATTEFRLQTNVCPVVEALPRGLTPGGSLRLSSSTKAFDPSPENFTHVEEHRSLVLDSSRHLCTRSAIYTDEQSFRCDFSGTVYKTLTGTTYVISGSKHVAGIGTSFLSEVQIGKYIKLTAHAETVLTRVSDVLSDTELTLEDVYAGATGNGVGQLSSWLYATAVGGSITQAASAIALATGPTAGESSGITRGGDYLPMLLMFEAKVDQRIADQASHVGLADAGIGLSAKEACVIFDGVDSTQVRFSTAHGTTDVETTTVTLPFGAVTSDYNKYQIKVLATTASLWINGIAVAEHHSHIPGPYDVMDLRAQIKNTGAAAGSGTLSIDNLLLLNFDRIDIGMSPNSDDMVARPKPASLATTANVAAAMVDTALLAYNASRLGAAVYNDSAASLYLKLGAGASPTSFTVLVRGGGYYEVPFNYVGAINGYWASAAGSARVTEVL